MQPVQEEEENMFEYAVSQVVKVVDGDTLDLVLDLGFSIRIKTRVRLIGIDTAEMASKEKGEKERAKAARDFVRGWLEASDGELIARTTKDDKYGRMLAEISRPDGATLTGALLDARLAKRYSVR
jgi:micrococcal nuclease